MKNHRTSDVINVKWMSAETLVKAIQDAWEKYGKENVEFDVDTQYEEYSDSPFATASLICNRDMTPEELDKARADAVRQQELRDMHEKEMYQRLAKKFGGKVP